MTDKEKLVTDRLHSLLFRRFNKESLNKELSKLFGQEIQVCEMDYDDEWSCDWCFTFGTEGEISGVFDLYFLKMREQPEDNDDELRFLITEYNYFFD